MGNGHEDIICVHPHCHLKHLINIGINVRGPILLDICVQFTYFILLFYSCTGKQNEFNDMMEATSLMVLDRRHINRNETGPIC